MNKFTKLILTSAVFATSGFATTIAELQNGGEVKSGATIDFKGQTLTLAKDASIDVYGDLTGTGTINCSGTGQVNVYGNAYKEDSTNKDNILDAAGLSGLTVHTLDESNKGSIAETITVEPSSALNKTNADLASYAAEIDETHLVYVANSDGSDTKCVGKTGSALEIKASLANADASIPGLTPSALVVENKLKFSGDNSGFTGKAVTIGTTETPAEVEYASAKSAFQVDTTVENGSKLTITPTEEVTLSKNLTINGSSKFSLNETKDQVLHEVSGGYLNVTGKLIIPSGVKLQLGTEYEASPIAENPSEYPKVMSWPVGSFSGELTKLYKNYYTVTFTDGSPLSFYYDESSKYWNQVYDPSSGVMGDMLQFNKTDSGELEIKGYLSGNVTKDSLSSLDSREADGKTYYTVPLKYGESVEIYEDPDNAGQYKTDAEGYSVNVYSNNISVSGNGYANIKTLSTEEVASPSRKELIYAKDDVFSYNYDEENDSWVRRAQYMIFQPGSIAISDITEDKSTWRIFELTTGIESEKGTCTLAFIKTNGSASSHITILGAPNGSGVIQNYAWGGGGYDLTEFGTKESGSWSNERNAYDKMGEFTKQIDAWARTHTFEETWYTIDELNAKNGTSYTWK